MIVEQAFVALPELLLGNPYAAQEYEAGIVGVFSMAILQELNGRNASNPIQHLQAEKRYSQHFARRADLFVDVEQLMVANDRLSQYGWRHHNWIEAKFYRNKPALQRHATNKSAFQGQLVSDALRLTSLVPLQPGHRDTNGRYLLHVYDDEPRYYLPYQDRSWVKLLHQAGQNEIIIDGLADESPTAKSQFGETLDRIRIQATVSSLINFPISDIDPDAGTHYWCVLTRFDAFSVTLNDRAFWVHANRVTGETNPGDHAAIAETVRQGLGVTKTSEAPGSASS